MQVFVRMRPSLDESDGKPVMRTDTTRKLLWLDAADTAGPPLQFEYDGVLAAEDGQERVYTEIAQPLVDAATVGRAACLMCYGQTGTGKTYTFGGALAALDPTTSGLWHSPFDAHRASLVRARGSNDVGARSQVERSCARTRRRRTGWWAARCDICWSVQSPSG